jgi:hypothetical protein
MIKWFAANKLVLSLDKTSTMEFVRNYSLHSALHTGYKEKYIEESTYKISWFTNG